ncbi:MAG: hypothetical protein PVF68_08745 [Acidobacteriota bacterium]|jgi:hypothetical protein
MRRYRPFQRAGLLLAGFLLGLPPVPASGLPAEDLRQLLVRGFPEEVILAIVEEEGPPALSPVEWLELRDLGASDRLLLALLPPEPHATTPPAATDLPAGPTPAPVTGDEGPAFRAFYDHDPDVGRVFVVTNLDPDGEPMAGTTAGGRLPNRVTSPDLPAPPPPVEDDAPAAAHPREAVEAAILPVAAAPPPAAFVGVSPYYGFFFPYPISHLYPPGSYTHNKLFHLGGSRGFSHYQLPAGQVFYLPPFPGAGSHPPGFR